VQVVVGAAEHAGGTRRARGPLANGTGIAQGRDGKGTCIGAAILFAPGASDAGRVGSVADAASGEPVAGALATFQRGAPAHAITVYTDSDRRFASPAITRPGLSANRWYQLLLERIGDAAAREQAQAPAHNHGSETIEGIEKKG